MATTTIGELLLHMSIDGDKKVVSALQRVTKSVTKNESSMKSSAKTTINFTATIGALVKGFAGLAIIKSTGKMLSYFFDELKKGISVGLEYNASIEYLQASMEALTGSQKIANALTKEMVKLAAETPFATKDYAKAAKTLLGYGVAQEDVMSTMEMLGNVAMGNTVSFDKLALAFGQVTAKGKLQAEEVRQMVNQGFNPLQFIAEETGVKMEDLSDKMRAGEISATQVTAAFEAATTGTGRFKDSMDKLSKTYKGQKEKIKEYYEIFWGNLTKPLYDFLASQVFPKIVEHLITAGDTATVIGQYFERLAKSIVNVSKGFASLAKTTIVGTLVNIKEKLSKFVEVTKILIDTFKSGDAATIEAVLLAFFPDWLEPKAEAISKILVIIRDDFDGLGTAIANIVKGGDLTTLKLMFEALLPKDFVDTALDFANMIITIRSAIQGLSDWISMVSDKMVSMWDALVKSLIPAGQFLYDIFLPAIKQLIKAFGSVDLEPLKEALGRLGDAFNRLMPVLKFITGIIGVVLYAALTAVMGAISGVVAAIIPLTTVVVEAMTFIVESVNMGVAVMSAIIARDGKGMLDAFLGIWTAIEGLFTQAILAIGQIVWNIVRAIVEGFMHLYDVLVGNSIIPDLVNDIIRWFVKLGKRVIDAAIRLKDKVIYYFRFLKSVVKSIFKFITTDSIRKLKELASRGIDIIMRFVNKMYNKFISLKTKIKSSLKGIAKDAKNILKGLGDKAYKWGSNMIKQFVSGIKSKIQSAKNAVSSVSSAVKDYLGWSSPTKKGAGRDSDKWMPNFMKMIIKGMESYKDKISRVAGNISSQIQTGIQGALGRPDFGYNNPGYVAQGTSGKEVIGSINVTINTDNYASGRQLGKAFIRELNQKGILTHKI